VEWVDPLGLAAKEGDCPDLKGDTRLYSNKKQAVTEAKIRAGITDRDPVMDHWYVGGDKTRIGQSNYVYNENITHQGEAWLYKTDQGDRLIMVHSNDPKGAHVHAGMPKGGEITADFRDPDVRYQQVGGAHHYFYGTKS
jgi:hypothetical protein